MSYVSGYLDGIFNDPERPAWRADAARPVNWAAWYPVKSDAPLTDKLIGLPDQELFRMGLVAQGAPISSDQERWPIVLLSHGTGGAAQDMCWLGTHLAEHGFIAVGVSHHGNTSIEPYLPEGFLCWWERARDLTCALNWHSANGPFKNRLDLTKAFAAGFSLGGYTVLSLVGAITELHRFDSWLQRKTDAANGPREFPDLAIHIPQLIDQSEPFRQSIARHDKSYCDRRFKAMVAFAPAPPVRAFEPGSVAAINVPTKLIVGENDLEAPHDECALWLKSHNPSFDVTLLGKDIGHYVFLPQATDHGKTRDPDICLDPEYVDRGSIHQQSAEAAVTLFRKSMTSSG